MKVGNRDYRTIWMEGSSVLMIDQNLLPFEFKIHTCSDYPATCTAIRQMTVRGAGALGAAAGFALAQAFQSAPETGFREYVQQARQTIEATRPTARNLFHATEFVYKQASASSDPRRTARESALFLADEDAAASLRIGELGARLIADRAAILTHCNAGWLAFVDHGTALSPVYRAQAEGKKIFVYVDETRPRSQGARITAWELQQAGIPHAIIADNAAAYYMMLKQIDLVIVGADRIAQNGDTANKIGTLEKAISAREFQIPFYVAAPVSTLDLSCADGDEIIIEERDPEEMLYVQGLTRDGRKEEIMICAPGSPVLNPAFDITPARFITGFITEKGIFRPDELKNLA